MSPNEALVPTASGLFGLIVFRGSGFTWTLRICNIMVVMAVIIYRFRAIILHILGV